MQTREGCLNQIARQYAGHPAMVRLYSGKCNRYPSAARLGFRFPGTTRLGPGMSGMGEYFAANGLGDDASLTYGDTGIDKKAVGIGIGIGLLASVLYCHLV